MSRDGITVFGELYAVRDARRRFVRVPRVWLGHFPGVGLVTARTRAALESGRFLEADRASQWAPLSEVFYELDEPERAERARLGFPGERWRHAVQSTAMGVASGRPVFAHIEGQGVRVAHVCASPPGGFICDG